MNSTNLPYGSGSVIHIPRNTQHPYCARRYRGNNSNGNPLYIIIGYYATYEEAVQALADNADLSAEDLRRADMTFIEVLEHYLDSRQDLAVGTRKSFWLTAHHYCGQLLDVRYHDIRADDMREAMNRTDATSTKRLIKWLFASLDREAELLDIPGKRYAQLLGTVRRRATDARVNREAFSEEEMQQFMLHRNDRDMYIVLFLCYTGFRESAFRTILKENVNLEKMTVTGGVKTQAGYMREIPLHPIIQPYVRRMMQKPGKFLLTNEMGEAMSWSELYDRYQMAIAPYIKKHWVLHECRHTFRNKLDEARVEEYVICALMGHEMPNAGQRYYAKVTIEKKREAIMKLWDIDPHFKQKQRIKSVGRPKSTVNASHQKQYLLSGLDNESTLRQLFDAYMEENPSHLQARQLTKFKSVIRKLEDIMDISYNFITNEMIDDGIRKATTDFTKTELAFLVHEFDRYTGVKHLLEYDIEFNNKMETFRND